MTKIVLSSDYHFNFLSQFDKINSNGISTRLQEILDSITWAAAVGKQHGASMFVILGDLFERPEKLPTKEGLAIVDSLKTLSKLYKSKNVIAIPGNHDQISSNHNIVDIFSNVITVFNKPTFLDVDGGRLFFCPYTREPEDLYNVMKSFEQADCIGNKYLLAHFWDTTVMGVDQDAIQLDAFNSRFYSRILLGHYHVPTADTSNLAIYTGTLLNKKFSEAGPKGCWILDTVKNSVEFIINPNSPEFYAVEDTVILGNPSVVDSKAYYRVYCDADSVVDISQIMSMAKGFEILPKKDEHSTTSVSIDTVERRNSLTLKEFIFKNCHLFTPEGVDATEFKSRGEDLLGDYL